MKRKERFQWLAMVFCCVVSVAGFGAGARIIGASDFFGVGISLSFLCMWASLFFSVRTRRREFLAKRGDLAGSYRAKGGRHSDPLTLICAFVCVAVAGVAGFREHGFLLALPLVLAVTASYLAVRFSHTLTQHYAVPPPSFKRDGGGAL